MKIRITLIALGLTLSCLAQTNAPATNAPSKYPPGDYYSWQHPEWPPTPGPIFANPVIYRLSQTNLPGTTNYLVDDREIIFPEPTPAEIERSYEKTFLLEILVGEFVRTNLTEYLATGIIQVSIPGGAKSVGRALPENRQRYAAAKLLIADRARIASLRLLELKRPRRPADMEKIYQDFMKEKDEIQWAHVLHAPGVTKQATNNEVSR